jgi:uncharacterized protein YutD
MEVCNFLCKYIFLVNMLSQKVELNLREDASPRRRPRVAHSR